MYVEALLQSALFGQGPLNQQTSGGGLLSGFLNIFTSALGGMAQPPSLAGADPLSASLYGAGVPFDQFSSAYIPIPQEVSLPSTRLGGVPRAEVDLNINLNEPMLDMKIDERSSRVVNTAAPRIQINAQKAMSDRMRATKKGWAD